VTAKNYVIDNKQLVCTQHRTYSGFPSIAVANCSKMPQSSELKNAPRHPLCDRGIGFALLEFGFISSLTLLFSTWNGFAQSKRAFLPDCAFAGQFFVEAQTGPAGLPTCDSLPDCWCSKFEWSASWLAWSMA